MSDLAHVMLGEDEARTLTDEFAADVTALRGRYLVLYEGQAHLALGYSSWGDYCEAEFGVSDSEAYRMLDSDRLSRLFDDHARPSPQLGAGTDEGHENGAEPPAEPPEDDASAPAELPEPAVDSVRRRLMKTAREVSPERAIEVWEQAYPLYGVNATVKQVEQVAAGIVVTRDLTKDEKRFWTATRKALTTGDQQAARQALAIWRKGGVYSALDQIAGRANG
jgi:hypothetical protein